MQLRAFNFQERVAAELEENQVKIMEKTAKTLIYLILYGTLEHLEDGLRMYIFIRHKEALEEMVRMETRDKPTAHPVAEAAEVVEPAPLAGLPET